MSSLYGALWRLSELTGIGLGRIAPFVFERMIGKRGHKVRQ